MKRKKAIEILRGAIKKPNTKDGYLGQAIDMAIKALEQTRWLPISERLPEEEVEVLIYTADKKINKAYRRIKSWTEDCMEWLVFETLGYSYTYKDDEVVAWMPLPKPYEEGEENECSE